MTLPAWRPVVVGLILLLVVSNIYFLYRLQQIEEQPLPDQQTIRLGGTDAAPEANGIILVREDDPTGTLVVDGLPDLGPEQQYQLWLVRDEIRVSGAVFSVAEEGFTSIMVSAPEALPLYTRFGITIEPAGGSPGPTGDGVLRYSGPERDGDGG
jgi:anti-sigma-K factor RskA